VRDALLTAAQVGPFFRLEIGAPVTPPDWQPVRGLRAAQLTGLAAGTAGQLGTAEIRVAASVLHLSLAARLWAPVLASGLLRGVIPDLASLAVGSDLPVRLALADPAGRLADSTAQLTVLSLATVGQQLRKLESALPASLPGGLLRGNSASAMMGALGVFAAAYPGLAGQTAALAQALLCSDGLRGAGVLSPSRTPGPLSFRRRSCCLYYRVPGGGLCGDCCLTEPPSSPGNRSQPR
jgi:hypothetical protein